MKELLVVCLLGLGAVGFSAPSPETVLELPPSAENCRNSEGDFAVLRDGSVLFAYSHYVRGTGGDHDPAYIATRVSRDGGRTWSAASEKIVENEGAMNVMCASFLRLKDGSLALVYLRKNSESDCRPVMRVSRDEGKTWGAPVKCISDADVGYYVIENCRAERLRSGRLILPASLHEAKNGKVSDWAGKLVCAVSDDEGASWRLSGRPFATFDGQGRRLATQEPGIVQLKDGRLLMYARTDRGRQWFYYSSDDGDTWTKGEPGSLWGPLSPATVKRLSTGDLVAVWNDHEKHPEYAKAGPSWAKGMRRPLSIAVSRDDGRTWIHRRTLEDVPDGWYCYFGLVEHEGSLLIGSCAEKMLKHSRVIRVPLDWLYERETAGDWTLSGGGREALSLSFRGRRILSDVTTGFWTENYRSSRFGGRVAFVGRSGDTVTYAGTNGQLRLELRVALAPRRAKLTLTADFLRAPGPFEYGLNLPFDDLAVAGGVPNLRADGALAEVYPDIRFSALRAKELAFELPEAKLVLRNLGADAVFTLQDMRRNGRGHARFITAPTLDAPGRKVFTLEFEAESVFNAEEARARAKRLATPPVARLAVPMENAGFEAGRAKWNFSANAAVDASAADGAKSARIAIADPAKDKGVYITRLVPAVGGGEYRVVAKIRTEDVREATVAGFSPVGAALILEWCDKSGKWMQSGTYSRGLWGTNGWTTVTSDWATAPADAGFAEIFLTLRATGRAWFDDVRLERRLTGVDKIAPEDGATLTNNTPRFVWRLRQGVRRYAVELSTDPAFPAGRTQSFAAGGVAEYRLEKPLAPGRWYWRVNGRGQTDASAFSFVQTAPADRDCLPPALLTPAARVTAGDAPFEVSVRDSSPEARPTAAFAGVTAAFAGVRGDGSLVYRFAPPPGGWKPGLTAGDLVLTDAAGNRDARRFWLNNAPKPANDTVIAGDGRFAVSGRRFFPLGIYEVAPKYMLEVRRAGFDAVHTYRWESSQDDAACARYLDACWGAEGLRAFVGFDRHAIVLGDFEHLARRVAAIGAHPALFCWYLFDEPEIRGQFVAPDQLTACAELIRRLDPYHAVVMSTWNKTMNEYRRTWDTHWTQAYGDPADVVRQLDEHRRYLKDCPSPITLLVNCNDGALGKLWSKGLTPDPEKFAKDYDYLRACAFLGIVKECNGVWWWWFARDTRHYFTAAQAPKAWANVVSIVKEIGSLRPVVDADGAVRTGTVSVGKAKVVWWAKTVSGETMFIAVNTAKEPVSAEIAVPGFAPQKLDFRRHEVKVMRKVR